ncbi:unnamed protein product [Ranitomeya imitator]|uniref:Uncharacterized protein n=1 Tax=Ranitomeya imitator TaxID=111125 RepID=A0ABN9LYN9_9NEOB|nr:unnamed protein product [Ranitomeya imitator]
MRRRLNSGCSVRSGDSSCGLSGDRSRMSGVFSCSLPPTQDKPLGLVQEIGMDGISFTMVDSCNIKKEDDDLGKFVDLEFILAHTTNNPGGGGGGPTYPLPETPDSCSTHLRQ